MFAASSLCCNIEDCVSGHFIAYVSLLPPLLMPITLNLCDVQNFLSIRPRAIIEADVGEDVRFVEVTGTKCHDLWRAFTLHLITICFIYCLSKTIPFSVPITAA